MSDIRHEQPEQPGTGVLPVSAPADPATAAFEMLREEVALVRRAVAGLAAERASIDIPDYSETLAQILQANAMTAKRLKDLNEAPALQMSADSWAREIAKAGEAARHADHVALSQARATFQDTIENLQGLLRSARDAGRQDTWLIATGIAGIVAGTVLWAAIAGLLAPAEPARHGSPERQATAILGMSEEKAGEHLIQSASPQLWQDLVLGDRIVVANRETLNRCLHKTRENHNRAERCIIELLADPTAPQER